MVRGVSPADTQGQRGMSNSERGLVGEQGDGETSEGAGTPGTLHPLETLPQMKGSTVVPHLEAHGSGWKQLREPPSQTE